MKLSEKVQTYLKNNNWECVHESDTYLHYIKYSKTYDQLTHIFIQEYDDGVTVELGCNEKDMEVFKIRNIVSVLKRRNY